MGIKHWKASQCCICCQGHVLNIIASAFLFKKDKEAVEEAIKLANENESLPVEAAIIAEWKDAIAKKWHDLGALRKIHNFVKWLQASS